MKVMVVDDEEDIQSLFKQKFRKEIKAGKIEFHFALSAKTALEFLESPQKASLILVLSDINMPGMTGLELLRITKEKFPELKFFMITAYGDETNYQVAIDYGADDYITKPVDFDILKNKIINLE
ncbi:MAG TPA: response regulator [Microcoleus sp.]|nr:response regulator [Microcoleus sp.]